MMSGLVESVYFPAAEIRASGNRLGGIAIKYGARGRGPYGSETILSGSFGELESRQDIFLNFMHDRSRPLARTGGGGLVLIDSENILRFTASLPNTQLARDSLALVKSGVISGASIEFIALKEHYDRETRIISRADLLGIALVDVPAYKDSSVAAERRGALQDPLEALAPSTVFVEERRGNRMRASGSYTFGEPAIRSFGGRGRRPAKELVHEQAFDHTVETIRIDLNKIRNARNAVEQARIRSSMPEISLTFNASILASVRGGSLAVKRDKDKLNWSAELADTTAASDLAATAAVMSHALAVEPRYLVIPPGAGGIDEPVVEREEIPGDEDSAIIKEIRAATLTHLAIVARHRKGVQSPIEINDRAAPGLGAADYRSSIYSPSRGQNYYGPRL